MASFGTIHSLSGQIHPRTRKCLAASLLAKRPIGTPDGFQFGITNKSPEYLSKFPLGKIPSFEGADGFNLTESSAIAYYIADSAEDASMRAQLLGADAYSRAKILQYVFFAEMHIGEPILTLVGWRLGFGVYDKAKEDLHAAYMSNFLRYLEGEIKDKTWFVGDSGPTLADITIGGHIYVGLLGYIDAEMRKDYPELIRWYESLKSVPDLTELYTGPMVDVRKQPKED